MISRVRNVIQVKGADNSIKEFFAYIRNDKGLLDFNKVLPITFHVSTKLVEVFKIMAAYQDVWGSCSNASNVNIVNNTIAFTTTNSEPYKVLEELSSQFPLLEINHKWASEHGGFKCGESTYYLGHSYTIEIENCTLEAYNLYNDCWKKQILEYSAIS